MPAVLILVSVMFGLNAGVAAGPRNSPAAIDGPERVRVGLVLIDVAVRNRKDRPIRGLSLEDFELQVDGNRVSRNAIPVFEETCGEAPPQDALAGASSPKVSAPVSKQAPPMHGVVIYFDFTALSFPARAAALTASREYLARGSAPDEEFMILAYSRGDFTTVKDFTSDRSALAESVARLLDDRTTVDLDLPDEDDQLTAVAQVAHTPKCLPLAREFALEEQDRSIYSLDQLERVIKHLRGRKDRLSLVYMTDSLRLEPGAQYMRLCDTTPFMQGIHLGKPLESLIDAAEASGIAIYTVHAGGMVDETAGAIRYSGAIAREIAPAARAGMDAALGMQSTLALQTGGRSLRYTNDIAAIIESARQDLDCRYLIGYSPSNAPDGRRHAIRVKVKGASMVRHRPFFIDRIP